MSRLMEVARGRFGDLVATMTPRDRRLFVGLVVFVNVVIVGGLFWFGRGVLADLESKVDDREQTLSLVTALAAEQSTGAEEVERIEEELRRNSTQDLPSFIEKAAQQVGISAQLQGVREKGTTTVGTLEEKTYGVELSRLSLQQLVDFLHAIEAARYPLRVRTTKVKTLTTAGVKALNVTLEVSAFRLVDAATGATP